MARVTTTRLADDKDRPAVRVVVSAGVLRGRRTISQRVLRDLLAGIVGADWKRPNAPWRLSRRRRLPRERQEFIFVVGGRDSAGGEPPLPVGAERWDEADWARFHATRELLRMFDEACSASPHLTKAQVAKRLERRAGRWARARGLRCSLATLDRYRVRTDPTSYYFDGNVDRRGRGQRRRQRTAKRRKEVKSR